MKHHKYSSEIIWTGNLGNGTKSYTAYSRDYLVKIKGKPVLSGSADPLFRGSAEKHNPEELFLASISSCHMLWYLHLCSEKGVTVVEYKDSAAGVMEQNDDGRGKFTSVVLKPVVTITQFKNQAPALSLHEKANEMCFIANSCSFPIQHKAEIIVKS